MTFYRMKKESIEDLIFVQLRRSNQQDRNLLTILGNGRSDLWQPWENTLTGQRGQTYEAKKNGIAYELIKKTARAIGPLKDLQLVDTYTPLTIRDWVASPNGSAYGIQRSTDQMLSAALLNRTTLKGLYLAGQNVMAPGILGTILGSLTTIKFIIGAAEFKRRIVL